MSQHLIVRGISYYFVLMAASRRRHLRAPVSATRHKDLTQARFEVLFARTSSLTLQTFEGTNFSDKVRSWGVSQASCCTSQRAPLQRRGYEDNRQFAALPCITFSMPSHTSLTPPLVCVESPTNTIADLCSSHPHSLWQSWLMQAALQTQTGAWYSIEMGRRHRAPC